MSPRSWNYLNTIYTCLIIFWFVYLLIESSITSILPAVSSKLTIFVTIIFFFSLLVITFLVPWSVKLSEIRRNSFLVLRHVCLHASALTLTLSLIGRRGPIETKFSDDEECRLTSEAGTTHSGCWLEPPRDWQHWTTKWWGQYCSADHFCINHNISIIFLCRWFIIMSVLEKKKLEEAQEHVRFGFLKSNCCHWSNISGKQKNIWRPHHWSSSLTLTGTLQVTSSPELPLHTRLARIMNSPRSVCWEQWTVTSRCTASSRQARCWSRRCWSAGTWVRWRTLPAWQSGEL